MLEGLKQNFTELIALYEGERQHNAELSEKLSQSQVQLGEYRQQVADLTRKIDNLKLTGAFTGNGSNSEAKERIDKLVREIDRCIKLLEK